ncbi:hypothetical protein FHS39_003271 [Streptomyces olivoverticillatus]|uniref:Transposase IS701-like DDE domain-containing protein n=1 Tax=Streptomyces olivoverticillatus TaxID=66427 RepID=A0A7W7LQ60_9ACTN|nr:transposase [Streptomyces olivoverticillatus]MBB4894237.1 hypothetical protein [Streptomyces olivoverticillatus]
MTATATAHVVTRLPARQAQPHDPFTPFAQEVFAELPRADQRRWARVYLEGLLAAPGRKSIRQLAATSGLPGAALSLQQFVNASPWDWKPVRRALLRWSEQRTAATAWTVGLTAIPKRGEHSAGVHRRFVPALGRTINCQVGVGIFLAGDGRQIPVDWRLLVPGRWSDDEELRARARIPALYRERPLAAYVLGMVESLARETGALPLPVVADMSHEQDAGSLVRALGDRRYDHVIAVPPSLPLLPFAQDPADGGPLGARLLLGRHGSAVTALHGTAAGGTRGVRVLTCLVRLPGVTATRSVYRLFAEWDPVGNRPARLWLTNLIHDRTERLLTLAAAQDASATLDTLAEDFGISAFEGRSYPGWHHHMTLVSAAYAFARLSGTGHGAHRVPVCRATA